MSDSVNRELVLGYIDYVRVIGIGKKKALEYIRKYVEHLPSDRPNGKWIEIGNISHSYKCSVCGRTLFHTTVGKSHVAKIYPYCHCGADMRGDVR